MKNLNLVFLPGLLCDASLFQHQASALADLGGITVVDLTGSDSIAALAEDALAQAPEGPLVILGMSMGGYVAFEIMRRAPDRVQALVLMCTSAKADNREAIANRKKLIAQAAKGFPAVIEGLLKRMAHPDHANTPEVGGVFQSMASGLGRVVFERQQRAIMGRIDSRPTLAKIKCPTLILCGRDDELIPLDVHLEMTEAISGARLEVVDDCGHLLPLEQPEQLTLFLRDWLCKLSTERSAGAARKQRTAPQQVSS